MSETLSLKTIIKELLFNETLEKKDLLLFANKLIEKIPDPRNAKKHYQSFVRKKNAKSVKQSQIITYQLKTFENSNIVDMKSVITEHPKTSHKLPKTIREAEKVRSNSSLYSDAKSEKFLNEKKCKNNKENMLLKAFQVIIMLKF